MSRIWRLGNANSSPRCGHVRIELGERYVSVSTGGGGHGNPMERGPREGTLRRSRWLRLTREGTALSSGVVVDDELEPRIIGDETSRLRESLSAESRPMVVPAQPGAGTWAQDNMKDGDVYLLNPA